MIKETTGELVFPSTNDSRFTVKLTYTELCDTETAISTIIFNGMQVKSSGPYQYEYWLNGTIKVNGTTVYTSDSETGYQARVYITAQNAYKSATIGGSGGVLLSDFATAENIAHDSDGSGSVDISLDFTWYTTSGGGGSGWKVESTTTIDLTPVARGLVYIDDGYGFKACQCYIDNGSGWDLVIPYIDDGSSWTLIS